MKPHQLPSGHCRVQIRINGKTASKIFMTRTEAEIFAAQYNATYSKSSKKKEIATKELVSRILSTSSDGKKKDILIVQKKPLKKLIICLGMISKSIVPNC